MKPRIAILSIAALLAAWVAMPIVAADAAGKPPVAPLVKKQSETQGTAEKPAPSPVAASKTAQTEVADIGEAAPAKPQSPKTLLAADSQARPGPRSIASSHASRLVRDPSVNRRKAAAVSLKRSSMLTRVGRFASLRGGIEKPAKLTRGSMTTVMARRKADAVAAAKPLAPTANAAQGTSPQPTAETPTQIPAQAKRPAPAGVRQDVTAARTVVTPLRQHPQQTTRQTRVIEPAPPLDDWEKYVAKTSAMYQFTNAQDDKAKSILTDLKHRARQYQLTRAPAFEEAERLADAKAKSDRLKKLNGPVDRLFDELKQRLDNLPTIPQKLHAQRQSVHEK